jgi:DNA-directed RNA polymerase III subunit RPC11
VSESIEDFRHFENLLLSQEVDHVMGGSEAWKNVDSTDADCPACSHNRAYFMQMQIRSADEPMTTFYRCANPLCNHNWRD